MHQQNTEIRHPAFWGQNQQLFLYFPHLLVPSQVSRSQSPREYFVSSLFLLLAFWIHLFFYNPGIRELAVNTLWAREKTRIPTYDPRVLPMCVQSGYDNLSLRCRIPRRRKFGIVSETEEITSPWLSQCLPHYVQPDRLCLCSCSLNCCNLAQYRVQIV